jgi:hypothetical protein
MILKPVSFPTRYYRYFTSLLIIIILSGFCLDSINIHDTAPESKGVVLSFFFNYQKDPQRTEIYNDILSYSKNWTESISKAGVKGIIFTNLQNEIQIEELIKLGIKVVSVSTESPLFKSNADQTNVDMKFIFAENWLKDQIFNSNTHPFEYILITDLSDVQIWKDPFPFLIGYDRLMGENQIYIGSEINGGWNWQVNYWRNCWGEWIPEKYRNEMFYNPGIVGGHWSIMLNFLSEISFHLKNAKRKNATMSCDMQASWKALDQFRGRIFTGYPLHSRYKVYENSTCGAFIKHK